MEFENLLTLGFLIIVIGVFVMAFGMVKGMKEGKAEGGGAVVIGPFPIAFGTSKTIAKIMTAVAIIIAVAFIIFSLLSVGKLGF